MAEALQEPPTEAAPSNRPVTIKRFQIGVNVIIQLIVVALMVGMVNYLSFNHFKRWDLSRDQKYILSEQTKRLLAGLKKPVRAVVFFASGSEIYPDAVALLREYEYAAKKDFQTEIVEPYRNFSRARELQAKYKFGANENVVILDYDGRSKFVNAADMAEFDQSGVMMGQPPILKAFKGEQAITAALLELTEEKQNKIYLVGGHGEPEFSAATTPDETTSADSLKGLSTYLGRQNVKADSLKLADVEKVPDDARMLLIIAPKYDFSEREMKLIREYWEKKGRIFIALEPSDTLPRLSAFLEENAIQPQDDRVLRTVNLGTVTGIVRDVTAEILPGTAVTQRLAGVDLPLAGQTQSITIDRQKAQAFALTVANLIQASRGYWGETDYRGGENSPLYFDPKKDHGGLDTPPTIAASVEKGAVADNRVKVETSRLIVVGNGEFLKDQALTEAGLDFALAGFNWLLDREELIGVAPKERKNFILQLDEKRMFWLFVLVVLGIPSLVAMTGLLSWWQRRN
jgi:ABC-type uncharacterized transport system involved in gliding motility auxiliary subunit